MALTPAQLTLKGKTHWRGMVEKVRGMDGPDGLHGRFGPRACSQNVTPRLGRSVVWMSEPQSACLCLASDFPSHSFLRLMRHASDLAESHSQSEYHPVRHYAPLRLKIDTLNRQTLANQRCKV